MRVVIIHFIIQKLCASDTNGVSSVNTLAGRFSDTHAKLDHKELYKAQYRFILVQSAAM